MGVPMDINTLIIGATVGAFIGLGVGVLGLASVNTQRSRAEPSGKLTSCPKREIFRAPFRSASPDQWQ